MERCDVAVVGGGNAAYAAALAAAEGGSSVRLLEKAPAQWAGGNSYFTAGAFRAAIADLDTAASLIVEAPPRDRVVLPAYPVGAFSADLDRLTRGRADADLAGVVTEQSTDTLRWLVSHGQRFELLYDRQAVEVDGQWVFAGGLYLGVVGEGPALMSGHLDAAGAAGVTVRHDAPVTTVRRVGGTFEVQVGGSEPHVVRAQAVVLATGGFEADPSARAQYLGAGWDLARVRGTPFNTGDGHRIARSLGAQPHGHYSGAHAVAWEAGAPAYHGDRQARHLLTKQSYWLGILVNADGKRFIDEGSDLRAYTYALIGGAILQQPGAVAYQVFDERTRHLLRPTEYDRTDAGAVQADTIAELGSAIDVPEGTLEETVQTYNDGTTEGHFDPSGRDRLSTRGVDPPKSNWATPISQPPFHAYPVTCGITFTFGGIRVDTEGRVLDYRGVAIPGLFAAGELVGGLFYHNYPGGAGLTAGAVLGRRAGGAAADRTS